MIYNNVKTLKLGDKRVLRVINKEKAVFPNVVSDGLILWYDLEGYTNQNVNREVAHDYSGNGRNGSLENFLFDAESGYNNGLIFDGVDDFIQLPELNLDVDDYSVQLNDKIYSFRGEQVAHTAQSDIDTAIDGIEVGGRNLILNSIKEPRLSTVVTYGAIMEYVYFSNAGLKEGDTVTYSVGVEDIPDGESCNIRVDFHKTRSAYTTHKYGSLQVSSSGKLFITFNVPNIDEYPMFRCRIMPVSYTEDYQVNRLHNKLEKGTKATDWTPAPEDLLSTQFKTTEKLKSLRYWNRALTDSELLTMYNIEKKR